MKPLGERTIIKVKKLIKKDVNGQEYEDISREGKVIETTHPELKKGSIVYYNPRGCINIEVEADKKSLTLAVDNDDLYVLC